MKKVVALIAGGVVLVGGTGALLLTQTNVFNAVKNTYSEQSQAGKKDDGAIVTVGACDVLTEQIAKQILGDGATKAEPTKDSSSTNDLLVTDCLYASEIKPGSTEANNIKVVSVLLRSGKTKVGMASNKSLFGTSKSTKAQDLSGLGDAAYFEPDAGQINVLKGGNWYLLSTSNTGGAGSTVLEPTKQLGLSLKLL